MVDCYTIHTAASIRKNSPNMVIYPDPSNYGWGAYFQGVQAQGKFPPEQADLCINSKETIAVYNGVTSFEPFFDGFHLLIRSDNTTAIVFAQDMGGMSSLLRDHWACQLWRRAEKAGYWISVAHIAGADNFQADFTSRVFNDRTDWAVPQYIFDKLVHQFGCPSIDLFTTQLNRKLKRYVSCFPDPTSTEMDAFSIEWKHEFPYLFLPFNLIYRCLKTVQQQKWKKH